MRNKIRGNTVDLAMLSRVIKMSRITLTEIAAALKITYLTLRHKLDGATEFTLWEAVQLTTILHLTKAERDSIFFGD